MFTLQTLYSGGSCVSYKSLASNPFTMKVVSTKINYCFFLLPFSHTDNNHSHISYPSRAHLSGYEFSACALLRRGVPSDASICAICFNRRRFLWPASEEGYEVVV